MRLPPFHLDHWLAKHEFRTPPVRYNLASSTGPRWNLAELQALPHGELDLAQVPIVYAPPEGSRELREAIAAHHDVDPGPAPRRNPPRCGPCAMKRPITGQPGAIPDIRGLDTEIGEPKHAGIELERRWLVNPAARHDMRQPPHSIPRRPRESGDPACAFGRCARTKSEVPAFAGMTKSFGATDCSGRTERFGRVSA